MRFVKSQVLSPQEVVDRKREDTMNTKRSGVARFRRLLTEGNCCVVMGGSRRKFCESMCVANHILPEWKGLVQYGRLLITEVRVLFRAVARSRRIVEP
jgi:hypothetical protein